MTKIDIFSGFLGAGKTTLIKKLIAEVYRGQKLVLIENEFGEIGIDGGFMADAGITVNEMNSGCICCSLTGDFREALRLVMAQYAPDRILIEPSGVGKLTDVVAAVQSAQLENAELGGLCAVVDGSKAKLYMKNFGEFFLDQIHAANCVVLSRTGKMTQEKIDQAVALVRAENHEAVIVSTPWDELTGRQILDAIEQKNSISEELAALLAEHEEHECDDPDCGCHHHHDHDHDHEHHHHHDHDEHDHHHEHEHHHEHDEHCCCHDHDHDHDHDHEHDHDHDHHHHHHHGHDADEVFQSWGAETSHAFTREGLETILAALEDTERFGFIVRAKGYVAAPDGTWLHFDYTPGEAEIRTGAANVTGRVCVIGAGLKEDAAKELFGLG